MRSMSDPFTEHIKRDKQVPYSDAGGGGSGRVVKGGQKKFLV